MSSYSAGVVLQSSRTNPKSFLHSVGLTLAVAQRTNKTMAELKEYLLVCEALRSLFPSQLEELAGAAVIDFVSKGNDVFCRGDAADTVFLLASGAAQITHADENGKRAILQVVGPGKLFGQCALIDAGQREARCSTTADSMIVTLPVGSLKKLMVENSRLASDLMLDIGNIMRALAHRLASVLLRPKRQRLLDVLQYFAVSDGIQVKNAIQIPHVFSHQQLSDMIGASRETVTITLGQLKQEGIIAFDGRRIMMLPESNCESPE